MISIVAAAVVFFAARWMSNDYVFFAGYTVLQFIVLATAWNILGGYTGYVNFGSAAFFALGAYASVFLHKTYPLPIPLLIVIGAVISGFVGLGMGYLTLRLRGAFFAIATLALAVVLQTLITNWSYVGGSRGAYVIRPDEIEPIGPYIQYLFLLMLALAVIALVVARFIERSRLGLGFAAIRDDELAAEASGVPTLKLKLIATTISGALMGRETVHDGAVEVHGAHLVRERAADAIDERRFARAVRADEAKPLAGGDGQRDAVECHEAAEALAQVVDLKQRGHGLPLPVATSRGRSSRPQARQITSASTETSQSQDGPGTTLNVAPATGSVMSQGRPIIRPRAIARKISTPQKMISSGRAVSASWCRK